MKANAAARAAHAANADRAGDAAVSSVVSAVLVFSLFSTAFVMWSITQLPGWVEDRETSHQATARTTLAGMESGLERLSAGGEQGPVTGYVPLAPRPIPLLGSVPQSGHLHFEDGVLFDATFTSPRLHVAGASVAGTPTAAPQTVTGLGATRHLHVSLDSSGVVSGTDQAWIEASYTDGTRTFTARVLHAGSDVATDCAGRGVLVRVTTDAGSRDHTLLCESGSGVTDFTIDLLAPQFGLAGRLGDLDAGHELTVTTGASGGGGTSASGTFLAVWSDVDGNTRAVGTGTSTPGYAVHREGGRVVFEAARAEATREVLSWEYGAVVADQGESTGASGVAIEPNLRIAVDGTTGLVRWTVVNLAGAGDVSGSSVGTLQVTHEETNEVVLSATGAELLLTTPTAGAWRSYLEAAVLAAGTTDATVSGTGDEARLTLGTGTVTEWVLHLRVVDARAEVR